MAKSYRVSDIAIHVGAGVEFSAIAEAVQASIDRYLDTISESSFASELAPATIRIVPLPPPVATVAKVPTPAPSPAKERATVRREIDHLLVDDARRTPAFATARRAAVLAYAEHYPGADTQEAIGVLMLCRAYEYLRGGMGRPTEAAIDYAEDRFAPLSCALAAYERARGMR